MTGLLPHHAAWLCRTSCKGSRSQLRALSCGAASLPGVAALSVHPVQGAHHTDTAFLTPHPQAQAEYKNRLAKAEEEKEQWRNEVGMEAYWDCWTHAATHRAGDCTGSATGTHL